MNRRELIRVLSGGVAGIPAVKSIERLTANENDAIVVTAQKRLAPEARNHLAETMKSVFPKSKILILDGGLELKAVREEQS